MSRKFLTPKDEYAGSRTVKAFEALTDLQTHALNLSITIWKLLKSSAVTKADFIAGCSCNLQSCELSIFPGFTALL